MWQVSYFNLHTNEWKQTVRRVRGSSNHHIVVMLWEDQNHLPSEQSASALTSFRDKIIMCALVIMILHNAFLLVLPTCTGYLSYPRIHSKSYPFLYQNPLWQALFHFPIFMSISEIVHNNNAKFPEFNNKRFKSYFRYFPYFYFILSLNNLWNYYELKSMIFISRIVLKIHPK